MNQPRYVEPAMASISDTRIPGSSLKALMGMNHDLASLVNQVSAFKPEISLLMELYIAEKKGQHIKTSALGLVSGIPQTTAVRCLRYLEEEGWVGRIPDETDLRTSYPRLSPNVFKEMDKIFRQRDVWARRR